MTVTAYDGTGQVIGRKAKVLFAPPGPDDNNAGRDADRATEKGAMTEHEAAWPPEDIELALDDDSDIDSDSEEIYDTKGNPITDEYVRDAISDVHRAIDEGRVLVPTSRPGRPSLTGESTHPPRVSFRPPRSCVNARGPAPSKRARVCPRWHGKPSNSSSGRDEHTTDTDRTCKTAKPNNDQSPGGGTIPGLGFRLGGVFTSGSSLGGISRLGDRFPPAE
ncbi:hypothetical protein GCM10027161_45790 [Microbispora hainanensis]